MTPWYRNGGFNTLTLWTCNFNIFTDSPQLFRAPHTDKPPEVATCPQEISAGKPTLRVSAKGIRFCGPASRGLVWLSYLTEISARSK